MQKISLNKIATYAVAIAIPLAVGLASALLTRGDMDIYQELTKPPLAPPAWLFPIAWTILYTLMGVSAGLVYLNREKAPAEARRGLLYYALSLAVNFFWSIIFFGMRSFILAFIWLILLLYLVVKTVLRYAKVERVAAYLQIPYILWLLFAGYLNLAVYLLN